MPAWGDQLRRWARPVGTGALEPLNAAHGSAQDAVGSRAAWTYRPIDDQTRSSLDGTERTTFQDEIRPEPGSESPKSSISLGEDTIALEELPWSAEEEKRLVRKYDPRRCVLFRCVPSAASSCIDLAGAVNIRTDC